MAAILFVYIGSREFRGIFKRHPMEPGIKAEVPHSRDRRKKSQVCPQRSNSPRLSYKIARCVAGLNCYEFKQIHVSVCNSKLKHLEQVMKSGMPADRRKILESKRLCLMKHIIQEEQYEDRDLALDLERGFSLVGEVPRSNVLPEKLIPATMNTKDLKQNAKKANLALRYMTGSSGSDDLDQKLWEKTQLEVSKGWMYVCMYVYIYETKLISLFTFALIVKLKKHIFVHEKTLYI